MRKIFFKKGATKIHIYHTLQRIFEPVTKDARKGEWMKENVKALAESYFVRISDGHDHAIKRPNINSDLGQSIDRALRRMVEFANQNGDCIINVGNGYYRPVPGDLVDEMELREYLAKDHSRSDNINLKIACMCQAFEMRRRETEYAKQQREGKARGA